MRAIKPRAYAFSSMHKVAYRKADAGRLLVQAFVKALMGGKRRQQNRAGVASRRCGNTAQEPATLGWGTFAAPVSRVPSNEILAYTQLGDAHRLGWGLT